MVFVFPPEILKPSFLPEMASVIDCVGDAGWVGIIVIIHKTASGERLWGSLGLGRSFVSRPGAGLWVPERVQRMGWLLASRAAPCLIMYQEARKDVGLSFQFRGRKKICGVSRLRNEQADLFRASERKKPDVFLKSHCD